MIRMESHCHTCYSPDSALAVTQIIRCCHKHRINAIIICDHDVYALTLEDENAFAVHGIQLFKGIEFTTSEGVHIIGVSDEIRKLARERGGYSARELADCLWEKGAAIIIPHPCHSTGILGNVNMSQADARHVLARADFIEQDNYRYGYTRQICSLLRKYRHLTALIGSDAHASNAVGAFYNEIDKFGDGQIALKGIRDVRKVKRKIQKDGYWEIKKIKKTALYQMLMNLFPADLRRCIKNNLINR